jgi:hypothetical protein
MRKLLFVSILLAACGGSDTKKPADTDVGNQADSGPVAGSTEDAGQQCPAEPFVGDECGTCLTENCCEIFEGFQAGTVDNETLLGCADTMCPISCWRCKGADVVIGKDEVCDEYEDCPDGDDELDCE